MGGASAGFWSVAENLALQRRILEERQARLQGLAGQSRDLCARARNAKERHGEGFPDLVGHDPVWNATPETVGEADALIQQIQVFNERLAKNLGQALAILEFKQIIRGLGGEGNERQALRASFASAPAPDKAEREAVIEGLLRGAGDSIAESAVLECARMAIEAEQRARFDTLKTELRYRIQKRNDAARARDEEIRLVARLRDRLDGLEGEEITSLAQELRRVEMGEIALAEALAANVDSQLAVALIIGGGLKLRMPIFIGVLVRAPPFQTPSMSTVTFLPVTESPSLSITNTFSRCPMSVSLTFGWMLLGEPAIQARNDCLVDRFTR